MSGAIIIDVLSWLFLLAGSAFLVIGAIGLIRMPDFYTRVHAVSVSDTLGAGFLLIGMMLHGGLTLVSAKLFIILAAFFFTSPLAGHAMMRAALAVGVRPVLLDRAGREKASAVPLIPQEPEAAIAEGTPVAVIGEGETSLTGEHPPRGEEPRP